ncbi:hypothetical protein [Halochromatium glycolicum]|uniref:hypothetical protein n=1 Tax=Halochromatium glycolicum TaxID=85075 RepID=UPI00190BE38D|nr:hypothetical protein [Halochromatium glycolicum]
MKRTEPEDAPRDLVVLAPGLLGPVPLPAEQVPTTPALSRLLSRGQRQDDDGADAAERRGLTQVLLQRFGAEASAPYARAADDPDWDRSGYLLHADPVHLRADRDQLRLFGASHFALSVDEAEALVAALNREFADDGLRLSAPAPSRWYLQPPAPPALETQPLDQVDGCSIDSASPAGTDAKHWSGFLSEVQMALFQSPVNAERERRGQPAINALWLWGGGTWRPLEAPGFQRLVAGSALAQGLADAAGITASHAALSEEAAAADPRLAGSLVVFEGLRQALQDADPLRWIEALRELEAGLDPALAALGRGRVGGIELDLTDGRRWRLERRDLRRFWRRRRTLTHWLDGLASG